MIDISKIPQQLIHLAILIEKQGETGISVEELEKRGIKKRTSHRKLPILRKAGLCHQVKINDDEPRYYTPGITLILPDVVTAPPNVATAPPDVVTALPNVATAPPDVVTAPPDVVTAPPDVVTAPPDVVTAPPDVATAPPDLGVPSAENPPQFNFPKIKSNERESRKEEFLKVEEGENPAALPVGEALAAALVEGQSPPKEPGSPSRSVSTPPERSKPATEFVAGSIFVPGEPYTAAFYNMLDEIGLRQTREPGLPLMQTSGYESFKQYAAETHRLFTTKKFSCGSKPVFDDVIHRIAFIFSLGFPCRNSKDDLWKIFNESKNEVCGTKQKVWTPILGRIRQDFIDNGFGWRNHLLPLYTTWEAEVKFAAAHGFDPRPELFPSYHADAQAHLVAVDGEAAAEPRPAQNSEGATIPVARDKIERGEIPNDLIRHRLRSIANDPADRNAATAAKLLDRIRQLETPPKSAPLPVPVPPTEPEKKTASSNAPKYSGLLLPKSLEAVKRNKIAAANGVISVGEAVRGMAAAVSPPPQLEPPPPKSAPQEPPKATRYFGGEPLPELTAEEIEDVRWRCETAEELEQALTLSALQKKNRFKVLAQR